MGRFTAIVIIGLVAAAVSTTCYLVTEWRYVEPLCRKAAAEQGWRFESVTGPDLIIRGRNRAAANVGRDPLCVFTDAQGRRQSRNVRTFSGGVGQDILMSLGMQLDLVFIVTAILAALIWGGLARVLSPGGTR